MLRHEARKVYSRAEFTLGSLSESPVVDGRVKAESPENPLSRQGAAAVRVARRICSDLSSLWVQGDTEARSPANAESEYSRYGGGQCLHIPELCKLQTASQGRRP